MDITTFRQQKDEYFRSPESPFLPAERESFTGLRYFPANEALRFELTLEPADVHESVTLQTSTGVPRRYRRAGTVSFTVNGERVTLTIFRDDHGFFLPFRDGTCDQESYGAGRYLEPEETAAGMLVVDFNLAYNPYCAYNEHYSCPLPPRENWTAVRLEAGEQRYRD